METWLLNSQISFLRQQNPKSRLACMSWNPRPTIYSKSWASLCLVSPSISNLYKLNTRL